MADQTDHHLAARQPPCLFLKNHIASGSYVLIIAESFRGRYAAVQGFLAALAEPVSRPPLMHEYRLTPFSLGTAVSNGVSAAEAMEFLVENTYELSGAVGLPAGGRRGGTALQRLHAEVAGFITSCMVRYDLARIVTDETRTMVQCKDLETATLLLSDRVIRSTVVQPPQAVHELVRWAGAGDEAALRPCFQLLSRAMSRAVAARCVVLGLPIQQRYDYERDPSIRPARISLRSQTKPRPYQVEAVEAATSDGTLNSGCLLLPCGAGKTLLGIMLMCKVKKPTLVVCAGSVSVEQWKNQILEYASLEAPLEDTAPGLARGTRSGAARISCLTGKQKDPIDDGTDVVLTTYSMLVSAHRAHARRMAQRQAAAAGAGVEPAAEAFTERGTRKRRANPKEQLFSSYGLLILDEVHVMPAEAFQESLSYIDAKGVIGLTATYVREDSKILDLFHLVGPKLYDVSMESLAAQGYLAKVNCVEVHTPMTKEFGLEYLQRSVQMAGSQRTGKVPVLVMLAAANPNKMLCVRQLVARHLDAGSKILVFCDHIMLLYEYGKLLGVPVISGKTQHKDRLMIFSDFQTTSKVNVICVSRVGDVSVNLPSANVVVQVSSHGGSRRQEAQRLGRILRPKERAANGKAVEAWFYSVVSTDSLEVAHAAHRTAFLVDQGYTCRLMHFNPAEARLRTLEEARRAAAATGAADSSPVKRLKEDEHGEVGDAASIKQEHLRTGRGPAARGGATAGGTGTTGDRMRALPYQLELLSKVVSSWEIEFQEATRKRKRARGDDAGGAPAGEDDLRATAAPRLAAGDSDDEVVVVEEERPQRTYDDIKQEMAEPTAASDAPEAANISDLVGVNDGFVYHEL